MRRENKILLKTKYIVCILLVCMIVLGGCDGARSLVKTNSTNTESTSKSSSSSNSSDVDTKVAALEELIDENFLFDIDSDSIEENIYKGVLNGLDDPYSVYYTAEEYKSLQESTSGKYSGIGVVVSQDPSTKAVTVVRPFKNGPGYEAGILPGDVIVAIGDKEINGEDLSEIVTWIKGEEGTTVDIKIYREGEPDYITLTVERRTIEVETVEYEMLDNNIGYVQVTEFDEVTADQYIAAVEDLKSQGMKGLIVDVRDNPGGLLNIVVDMLDYMLPKGMIVYTEDRDGNVVNEYKSTDDEQFTLPLAVLVNGDSASAAEIFSGAIKDYQLGTIIGTQTFGKGIVQRIFELNDGSAVKLTVSKYYTPNGYNIHGVGIEPDIVIDLPDELKTQVDISKEDDVQLQKAIEDVSSKIK